MGVVFALFGLLLITGAVVGLVIWLSSRSRATPSGGPSLEVHFGDGQTQQVSLNPQRPLLIGRAPDNDLVINHHLVSRQHARIFFHGDGWFLEDLGSANGTFVNSRPVGQVSFGPGDVIEIGPARIGLGAPALVPVVQPTGVNEPAALGNAKPTAFHVAPSNAQPSGQFPTPGQQANQQMLGPFAVVRPLGAGGMSRVVLAQDTRRNNQLIALKLSDLRDDYLIQKFNQEGTLNLSHPHIAQVYEVGTFGPQLYIAMEFVEGSSLRRLLQGRPWSLDFALPVIGQVLEGLEYAHRHQIVHRDIKPENMMISPQHGVKLIDFGIAKLLSTVTRTRDGLILGTPLYMSYEQAKGMPVNTTSDLYAVSIVLYELLTARQPFESSSGNPLEVLQRHLTTTPPSPRQFNPAIPPAIEEAILRNLEKDYRHRFPSAAAFAQALGIGAGVALPSALTSAVTRMILTLPQTGTPAPLVPPATPAKQYRLRVLSGPHNGQTILLDRSPLILGRNELNPTDQSISRQHVQIEQHAGVCTLADVSAHGTLVNNQPLARMTNCRLTPGTRIQIGQVILVCELAP